jgi:hypothetical protein
VLASFDKQYETLTANNPDTTQVINRVRTGLVKIGQLIQTSPQQNGNGITWKRLIDKAENEKNVLCKQLYTGVEGQSPAKVCSSREEDATHSRR